MSSIPSPPHITAFDKVLIAQFYVILKNGHLENRIRVKMHERLKNCILPVDVLLNESYDKLKSEMDSQDQITLNLFKNEKIVEESKKYISKLLKNKKKYGYLYYLEDQQLLMPLVVQFKSDIQLIKTEEKDAIVGEIQKIASGFGCRFGKIHEITMIELLYFFFKCIKPDFTWLAMESQVLSVPMHGHLLMSQEREHSYVEKEPTYNPINNLCQINLANNVNDEVPDVEEEVEISADLN